MIENMIMVHHAHDFAIGAGPLGKEVAKVARTLVERDTISSAEAERVLRRSACRLETRMRDRAVSYTLCRPLKQNESNETIGEKHV
jgi:hypothetical protein